MKGPVGPAQGPSPPQNLTGAAGPARRDATVLAWPDRAAQGQEHVMRDFTTGFEWACRCCGLVVELDPDASDVYEELERAGIPRRCSDTLALEVMSA